MCRDKTHDQSITHNFELKNVTSQITWMDNVSHRHHGNIKQLTNLIPQKVIHSMKIVTT